MTTMPMLFVTSRPAEAADRSRLIHPLAGGPLDTARDPAVFVQPCRLTMKLIQIGANGDVHPFDTG